MQTEEWADIAHRRVREFPMRLVFSMGIAAAIYLNDTSLWAIYWFVVAMAGQLVTTWVSAPMRRAGYVPTLWRKRCFVICVVASTSLYASVAAFAWFMESWQGRVLAVTVLAGGVMNVRLHASRSGAMLWTGTAPFIVLLVALPLISLAIEPGKTGAAFVCLANLMYVAHLVAATLRGREDARSLTASLELARTTSEDLKLAAAAAEAANTAKSEFLANMSHEIRTPLNGVMGVAGALARTELSPAQAEMVQLIETSAETLETLLSDILDLARIEAGKMELRAEPFDLAVSVKACAALFDAAAQAKGLDLQVEIAPDALGVHVGDAARLRQIVCNLLGNAVKFTARGQVRLVVSAERGETSSQLSFQVRDTGIGFDAETKARLFSRFEQADGSITRRFGGSGLGLAISRSLAEAMGGRLEADAVPGQGAVFTLSVELPRLATTPEVWIEDAGLEVGAPPPVGLRVLLAEDHPTNRRVVELILGATGVDLTCVEDGLEAIEAFRTAPFDLILMDMQMPVMDGLTAIREIRRLEAGGDLRPTPIHVLTANAMPEHVQASLAAGADGHLPKPIVAERLLERIQQVHLAALRAEVPQASPLKAPAA